MVPNPANAGLQVSQLYTSGWTHTYRYKIRKLWLITNNVPMC